MEYTSILRANEAQPYRSSVLTFGGDDDEVDPTPETMEEFIRAFRKEHSDTDSASDSEKSDEPMNEMNETDVMDGGEDRVKLSRRDSEEFNVVPTEDSESDAFSIVVEYDEPDDSDLEGIIIETDEPEKSEEESENITLDIEEDEPSDDIILPKVPAKMIKSNVPKSSEHKEESKKEERKSSDSEKKDSEKEEPEKKEEEESEKEEEEIEGAGEFDGINALLEQYRRSKAEKKK
jgi:hypothetical protein